MKRLLLSIVVLIPLSWALAGCDGSSSRKSSQPSAEEMQERAEKMKKKMAEMEKGQGRGGPVGAGKR